VGVSVRGDLSTAQRRGRRRHARDQCRGDERAPGRDQPPRLPRRHRLLVLDGAPWHTSPRLKRPDNIVLLPLPPYSPELNPMENVWEFMRGNFLSHRVWDSYDAIIAACCDGWNKLMRMPNRIASLTRRAWAITVIG
jgi:DDE superfamily endonuclease